MSTPKDSMPRPELKNTPPPKAESGEAPSSGDASSQDFGPGAFFAPALRADAEQFPVLKAFQTYLEEERERARRRVVAVSVAAIAAIVLIVAAFLVILMNQMNRNDQLFAALLANSGKASEPVAVQEAAPAAKPSKDHAEVVALNEKIAKLEQSNTALTKQMETLQALPEALADRMGAALSNAMASASAPESAVPKVSVAASQTAVPPASAKPVAKPTVRVSKPKKNAPAAPTEGPAVAEQTPPAQTPVAETKAPEKAAPEIPSLNVISVKPIANAKPMIDGYRGEDMVLTTDAGVKIPWRIAVEK